MQLTKHHGLGNDFLVALVETVPAGADELARRWCNRHRGIGADGLIFGVTSPATADAEVGMELFNADGSRAEISGNGIRCLAQAVHRSNGAGPTVRVAVVGETRSLLVTATDDPDEVVVDVDMGAVRPGPALPDDLDLRDLAPQRIGTANVGNRHVVLLVDPMVDPGVEGPGIEAAFGPAGINVHFLRPAGTDTIEVAHWERGAGVTEACGSGATVAAHLAREWNLVGSEVMVRMPGGNAEVHLGDRAVLRGPATFVATIEVDHTPRPGDHQRREQDHG